MQPQPCRAPISELRALQLGKRSDARMSRCMAYSVAACCAVLQRADTRAHLHADFNTHSHSYTCTHTHMPTDKTTHTRTHARTLTHTHTHTRTGDPRGSLCRFGGRRFPRGADQSPPREGNEAKYACVIRAARDPTGKLHGIPRTFETRREGYAPRGLSCRMGYASAVRRRWRLPASPCRRMPV